MDELPESDRLLEFPHPREQGALIGHAEAEQRLLKAYLGGKIHHAWILAGARGIGKATLAYRLARFVLKNPDPAALHAQSSTGLDVAADDPVFRRVAAGAHPNVFVVRREYDHRGKRLRREITAETVRDTTRFFTRTAGEGGWRICIVDAADDLNRTAANALLKVLEEPPPRALFILISHVPGRLLPTIRSRCVSLAMEGLEQDQWREVVQTLRQDAEGSDLAALADLSRGSPGRALALMSGKGWEIFRDLLACWSDTNKRSGGQGVAIAERLAARGAEEEFSTFFELLSDWLASRVRTTALGAPAAGNANGVGGGVLAMPAASLGHWSETWQKIMHSLARTNALNLDRKQTVLNAIHLIEETASASTR